MGIKYEKGILRLYKNGALATATATGIDQTKEIYAYIANDNTSATGYVRFDKDSWTQSANAGVDYTWQLSEGRSIGVKPTVLRPQRHFETLLYTGTGSSNSVTGLEFSPDLIWAKRRDTGGHHHLWVDTIRGGTKSLMSNNTDAENSNANRDMTFLANGIRWNSNTGNANASGGTYVVWCWKAGGTAVSNSDGTITSSVSANTEAGFSIVSFTGNATSGATVGHGLNKKPKWIIVKERGNTNDWTVYHESLGYTGGGDTYVLFLNLENDYGGGFAGGFNNTAPTSSVFSLGNSNETNKSGGSFIAYCWSEIPGYSKFGSYTGNGSSDGVVVELGFRPAWVMVKRVNQAAAWNIMDNKRAGYNSDNDYLQPDNDLAESDGSPGTVDLLSNGFKCTTTSGTHNNSGGTFVYMAFAAQPGPTPFDTFANSR